MTFANGLLAALGEPRPTETELRHKTATLSTGTSIEAYCTCGTGAFEVMGTDESSRNAAAAWVASHAGGAL